jgi:flavin-dependent dehydrogenase
MAEQSHDVAIIGGGLAGLTLALQLRRAEPGLSVVVLERSKLPPPLASHKVGESTVEIGAHYFSDTLGLGDLLERTQLRKFGLRLFFGAGLQDDLAEADELGASRLLPAISYQIDRGKFEGDLAEILAAEGVTVLDECVVRNTTISANGGTHSLVIKRQGREETITSRWVVDAGSRTALLKRKLGVGKARDHKISSAWFRLDTAIAVDDWSASDAWRQQCNRPRRLSTNHLMGPGYWVWIIPLAGDRTSIGLVADPAAHPLSTYSTFEKFCSWLSEHQPRLGREVLDARDTLMDFGFMKNLSQDSEQVWSRQRWALTGESGLFSDPFYSPGSDFIGISNTFIADLIARERANDQFSVHAAVYQQMYKSFYESTMSLYEHQYPGFGDTRLMVVKTTWDYAYYWSVLTWLYFRNVMTDIDFLREIQPRLIAMRELNLAMQGAFRQRAAERRQDAGRGRFFDQTAIPVLYDLNAALVNPEGSPRKEFDDNCQTLESLSPILLELLARESVTGSCSLLGDLRQRFN